MVFNQEFEFCVQYFFYFTLQKLNFFTLWGPALFDQGCLFVCLFVTGVLCTVEMLWMVQAPPEGLILIAGHPVQISAAPGEYSIRHDKEA